MDCSNSPITSRSGVPCRSPWTIRRNLSEEQQVIGSPFSNEYDGDNTEVDYHSIPCILELPQLRTNSIRRDPRPPLVRLVRRGVFHGGIHPGHLQCFRSEYKRQDIRNALLSISHLGDTTSGAK